MKKLIYSIITGFILLSAMFIGGFSYAQEESSTILMAGSDFRSTLSGLAGGLNNIEKIERTDDLSDRIKQEIQAEGEIVVYAWYDSGAIYYNTTATKIYLNPDSKSMFSEFGKLKEVDMTEFDTSKVTTMQTMFYGCRSLTSLDLRNFVTSGVTNMKSMFNGCSKLTNLDLRSFDTSNVTDMSSMFSNCSGLDLNLKNFDTSNVTTMQSMFNGYKNPIFLDLSSFDTSNVTDMRNMFLNSSVVKIDLSSFDTTRVGNMSKMFNNAKNLETVYASENFDVSLVTTHTGMFYGATKLEGGKGTKVSEVGVYDKTYALIDSETQSGYFTEKIQDSILLPGQEFNTILKDLAHSPNPEDDVNIKAFVRTGTFSPDEVDRQIISIDGAENPVYARYDDTDGTIFYYSESDTIYTNEDASKMFYRLGALERLDIDTIDTTKTKNMQGMFNGCKSIEKLDLSNFNTSNVTNMISMFHECTSLEALDLSSFDTSNVEKMRAMFNICSKLETIYVSEYFNTDNLVSGIDGSDNMFALDTKLVGGNGTVFDSDYKDKTYAFIDSDAQSGYFTDANNITVKFIKIDGTDQILQKKQTVSKGDNVTELTDEEIGETQTGHSLKYYLDTGMTEIFNFSQQITKYTEIYTQREINQYTITFVKGNGEPDEVITDDYGTGITAPTDPTREGYNFLGWDTEIPTTMPAENIIITAQWEVQKSGGGYSGGGGHSHDNSDNGSSREEKENNTQEQESTSTDNQNNDIETQRQDSTKSVHEWSYQNGLTQYANEKDARLGDYLTRSQMAKISSIFATKVLGKMPDESKNNFCSQFADISTLNTEMKSYVIESCELGYMGYQSNGTDSLVKFRPYSPITVAEAAVIVSRMLRGNQNAGDGNKWYQGHLYAAYNHELIDDIRNPFRNITRGEAFEIFYRTSQPK